MSAKAVSQEKRVVWPAYPFHARKPHGSAMPDLFTGSRIHGAGTKPGCCFTVRYWPTSDGIAFEEFYRATEGDIATLLTHWPDCIVGNPPWGQIQAQLLRIGHKPDALQDLTPPALLSLLGGVETCRITKEPEPSGPPKKLLFGWREILIALGRGDNREDRARVRNANKAYNGPIIVPKRGADPKVDKAELLAWWNGLEEQWISMAEKTANIKATVASQYDYGRDGGVIPDIGGGLKLRRADEKP